MRSLQLLEEAANWKPVPATQEIARSALPGKDRPPLYLFGRNEQSAIAAGTLLPEGFIDDYAPPGTTWNGRPVVRCEEAPSGATVVNCALAVRPQTAKDRIAQAGLRREVSYAELCASLEGAVPWPRIVTETRADILEHGDRWDDLYRSLADDESRRVLWDVTRFRLSGRPEALNGYVFRPRDQYWEGFVPLHEPVFVDAGGFDGETTELFASRHPDYRKVHFFEPAPSSMAVARERLRSVREVDFIMKGLSNEGATLRFDSNGGSANVISAQGDTTIEVTTLDQAVPGPVTYVKMDLEGWEIPALEGSRRHIEQDHPALAVAVYHRAADFWRIPEFVRSIRRDYRLYLRHYTEGWTETVMYFVPGRLA